MILRRLLRTDPLFRQGQTAFFPDHTLYTVSPGEKYPEHTMGWGLLTMLSDKQFLFINQGTRLKLSVPGEEVTTLLLFFKTHWTRSMLRQKNLDLSWIERIHPLEECLQERLEWLHRLGNSCSSFCALKADSIIRDIMDDLIDRADQAATLAAQLPVRRQTTKITLIRQLSFTREWIIAHLSTHITLEDMAGQAMMNSQHFLRMFQKCYGITPHQFLIDIRLQEACRLLRSSTDNILSICRQTGFDSSTSFSLLFRKKYGCSPSAYRRLKQ